MTPFDDAYDTNLLVDARTEPRAIAASRADWQEGGTYTCPEWRGLI